MVVVERATRYVQRKSARLLFRRPQVIDLSTPVISFTFDDFPRSALHIGGRILNNFGLFGTYYTALGILGESSPSGQLFLKEDLTAAVELGHELGCHTFSHLHSWRTESSVFEDAILRNSARLAELIPGARFRSFSYPMSEPHPMVKRATGRHFGCCRSGGQAINAGTADLDQLLAYFLEKANGKIAPIRDLINSNKKARGWLIFATHDVAPFPGPYGCAPEFFEAVVTYAVESGASILPVSKALELIQSRAELPRG